jgi:hypothetical protein
MGLKLTHFGTAFLPVQHTCSFFIVVINVIVYAMQAYGLFKFAAVSPHLSDMRIRDCEFMLM